MDSVTCDPVSLLLMKGKRPLISSEYDASCTRIDESSTAVAVLPGPKRAKITSADNNHPVLHLLSDVKHVSTEESDENKSLMNDERQVKRTDQKSRRVSLESTGFFADSSSVDRSLSSVSSNSAPCSVTPFSSMVDLIEVASDNKELVKSAPLVTMQESGTNELGADFDRQSSLAIPKRHDEIKNETNTETGTSHKIDISSREVNFLSKNALPSVTPFSSAVNLKREEDVNKELLKVRTLLEIKPGDCIDLREELVPCLDSSSIPSNDHEIKKVAKPQTKTQDFYLRSAFKFALLAVLFLSFSQSNSRQVLTSEHTVYVPGAGFSGFWYTLGKLRSISNPSEKEFYCYSSGCLAVVATFRNFTVDHVYAMARDVQVRWQEGDLHRYEVVAAFLNDLLGDTAVSTGNNDTTFDHTPLLSLNIITSVQRGRASLIPEIRRADSIESLRTMLLQTTWIPFAIGSGLWHNEHMDGAFTAGQHPVCALKVGLPIDFDIALNAVNINLGKDKVQKFYSMGLEHGF